MIRIVISRDDKDSSRGFTISGHSGYADKGSDIICSAISVLGQTAIASLTELTNLKTDYKIDEGSAFLECKVKLPDDETDTDHIKASVILDLFGLGCRRTAESYGRKYIDIRIINTRK